MADFNFVAVRDALHSQIETALPNVTVYKYPPGNQTIDENTTDETFEWVELGGVETDRTIESFGASGIRDDVMRIKGTIVIEAPGQEDAEASIAETRAPTILNAIESGLVTDDTLGGTVLVGTIVDVESTNGVTDRGRATQFEFTVECEAHNS